MLRKGASAGWLVIDRFQRRRVVLQRHAAEEKAAQLGGAAKELFVSAGGQQPDAWLVLDSLRRPSIYIDHARATQRAAELRGVLIELVTKEA